MKIKKSHILLSILIIVIILTTQAISAEDNTALDDTLCSTDSEYKISTDNDFQTPSEVNVNSTKKVEINYTSTENVVKSDLNLKLNKSNTISEITDFEVSNNKIRFDLTDNNFTQATLNIDYKNTTSKIVLKNIINIKIEALTETSEFQVGTYNFKVTDIDTGKAVAGENLQVRYQITGLVVMSQTQTITTNNEGIATFYLNKISNPNPDIESLPTGKHNITVTGQGQLKGELKTEITIKKADVIITPSSYSETKGSLKNFTMKITSKTTGEAIKYGHLTLYIPGSADLYYKLTTSKDGIGTIAVSRLNIGEYPVTITTNDTNLNNASADGKIQINKFKVKINVISVTKYYNSGKTTLIKITDSNGKAVKDATVQIIIDKKSYVYNTNNKGEVELLTSVNVGKHKMVVNVVGNTYTANSVSKTLNIKKSTGKLKLTNKKYYFNSEKYLNVKLTNTKNKKGIFNAKIYFKIKISKTKYSNYYGTTQREGKIKLNVDIKPGTYQVTVKGNDAKNFKAKAINTKITIKKAPVKLTVKTSKKQMQIQVKNKKSKKLVSGLKLKVKVYTGNKYKTITAKSNSKGICNVNLNSIKTGQHKVIISLDNDYYTLNNYKKTIKI